MVDAAIRSIASVSFSGCLVATTQIADVDSLTEFLTDRTIIYDGESSYILIS